MLGGKAQTLAKIQSIALSHLSAWKLKISPFSLWSIYTGWVATTALAGLIITIKVVGVFITNGEYADPFKRYEAILPGQPMSALTSYDCSVQQARINGQLIPQQFSCMISPFDGFFDIVHVEIRNNQITEVIFYATDVTLGQLLLHWKPVTRPNGKPALIKWESHPYSVEVYGLNADGHSIDLYDNDLPYHNQVCIIAVH